MKYKYTETIIIRSGSQILGRPTIVKNSSEKSIKKIGKQNHNRTTPSEFFFEDIFLNEIYKNSKVLSYKEMSTG